MELTVDQVNDILDNADLAYEAFTNSYSGRGMYGDRCVGFDVDSLTELGTLAIAIHEVLGDTLGRDMVENARTDNMGLGYIIYFPHHTCPTWVSDEDEDDDDDY